jgi:hypothetical protein
MLPAYNDCPRRAAARQFKKEIQGAGYKLRVQLPSIGAAVGTAVHKYIENYFVAKMQDLELANPIDEVMSLFEDEIKTGVIWDDTTTSIDTAKMQIERMATVYIEGVGKDLMPLATEVAVEAEITSQPPHNPSNLEGNKWQLTGHIDLVCKGENGVVIRDWKTGAVVRSHHAQLGAYSLLWRSRDADAEFFKHTDTTDLTDLHGFFSHVEGVAIDFIKRIPKRRGQEEAICTMYDVGLCERTAYATVFRIIGEFDKFMETGDYESFPANPMSMLCTEKYCECFGSDFCPITKILNKE